MDQIPVQFKWSRALADASPACKSYLHPTKHLQREREWWEDTFLLTRMFGVLDTAQSEPATATDSPNTKTLSNGRRPVRTQCEGRFRKMSNIACSIGFTVYMFDSFEMPNNLQRHNTEQVCRSVWAGHKKGGYSIGIFEGRAAKQQLQLPTLCLLRFVSEEYTVSVVTLAKTQA